MDQQVPETIDQRYKVGAIIGSGAMATVYEAVDTRLGRKVALKVLRAAHAQDDTVRARFQREAEAVAALNHQSIVAVYDTGSFDIQLGSSEVSLPFMVMELVQGTTLREAISNGDIDQSQAIAYGVQILEALDYSHNAGIIHRDIKPANVMILDQTDEDVQLGDFAQVKVMDFGIARAAEESSEAITKANTVMGTARYISPEQARGETADARSDVYSAACVVYEMLAGCSPFDAPTNVELAGKHLSEMPQPLGVYVEGISPALDEAVLKGLNKDPEGRYQSAGEFAEALKAIDADELVPLDAQEVTDETVPMSTVSLGATIASAVALPNHKRETEEASIGNFFDSAQEEFTDEELYGYGYGEDALIARKKRRRSAWGKALTTLLIIFLAAFGVGSVLYYQAELNKVPTHVIPAVQGLTKDEAETQLRNLNYVLKYEEEHSDSIPRGSVIKTSPVTGLEAEEGSEVVVTLSSGPSVLTIPGNLEGQSEQYVREALTTAGFVPGRTTTVTSPTIPAGMVVGVDPGSGEKADAGATVDIVLSNGKVEVPSLVGLDRDAAIAALTSADTLLGTNIETVPTSSQPAGTVVAQSVPAGTLVDQGSTVTISVATAPEPTFAPIPWPNFWSNQPSSTPAPSSSPGGASLPTSTSKPAN